MEKQTINNDQEEINPTEDEIISALRAICSEGYGQLTINIMKGKPYVMHVRYDVKFKEEEE